MSPPPSPLSNVSLILLCGCILPIPPCSGELTPTSLRTDDSGGNLTPRLGSLGGICGQRVFWPTLPYTIWITTTCTMTGHRVRLCERDTARRGQAGDLGVRVVDVGKGVEAWLPPPDKETTCFLFSVQRACSWFHVALEGY